MPDLPHFPSLMLPEAKWQWEISGQTIEPGQTASGVRPVTRMDGGGLWKVTLGEIRLWGSDTRRLWRALASMGDGGVQPFIVPMREMPDAPFPEGVTSYDPVYHEDDVPFEGDIGYAADVVDVVAAEAAAQGATTMRVEMVYGSAFQGGEFFSVDDATMRWRLYRISTVIDLGGDEYQITFRPPLRAAILDGARLSFDHPKCVMRLATPNTMDATFEKVWKSNPSVSFIECFPPFPT